MRILIMGFKKLNLWRIKLWKIILMNVNAMNVELVLHGKMMDYAIDV